jgi:RNase H-fold protein (predicted Holliday junction resolvase)
MATKYSVYIRYVNNDKKNITAYVLVQADTIEEANRTSVAVEFPINLVYDKKTQAQRADKMAEFLNKIVEMTNDLEKEQGI